MKVALACDLLDGRNYGMQIALEGFLEGVVQLGRQETFYLLHWPCQVLPPVHVPIPRVISVWDLAPLNFAETGWNTLSVSVKYKAVLYTALRSSSHVITHSRAIADEVVNYFEIPADKVSVIYPELAPASDNI